MLRTGCVGGDERQVDIRLCHRGELYLGLLCRLTQSLQSLPILAQIDPLLFFKLLGDVGDDPLIPIVASQVRVAVRRFHLDNAFAHFLSQAELAAACAGLSAMLEPGGLFLASIRDYDGLIQSRPDATPVRVFDGESERRLVFQVWDWAEDGASYDVTLYILRHYRDRLETLAFRTRCRALRRRDLTAALDAAGLQDVQWLEPEKSGFYQPVVAARRQR